MGKYDCIFFDRDGTINHDPGYISKLKDFIFFEFTISALNLLASITNKFIIITNPAQCYDPICGTKTDTPFDFHSVFIVHSIFITISIY